MAHSNFCSDIEYVHQLVYDLKLNELQVILDAVKQNKTGNKQCLRKRVLNLLSASSSKTRVLKQKILQVYRSRPKQNSQPLSQSQHLAQSLSYGIPYQTNPITSFNDTPPNSTAQFENLPFFKGMHTLLMPMHCQNNINAANFTGLYYLTEEIRQSISTSWIPERQEYKIQIILRLVQVGLEENMPERLPYNINVTVNDHQCKLPSLNIPTKAGITPWRCNVPIDITIPTNLKQCLQNTLKINWVEEPHEYMAGVFVAEKLTWKELLVELRKKPVRASEKTKEFIKKSMETDADMGIDSMFATVMDPLSKTRMELPARGINCIHLQCFDAVQFLQMNEYKQTWKCPLCKKKVKFDDIEIDQFFLNILQSSNLSEECENVNLLRDGTWTEKKTKELPSTNNIKSTNNIEVLTLSDSDEEEEVHSKIKPTKCSSSIFEESKIKSEHTAKTEDVTEIIDEHSSEDDLVLDLSLKNSLLQSTSSNYQPDVTLNGNSDLPQLMPSSSELTNFFLPNITITENSFKDCKPSSSGSNKRNRAHEKDKSRGVICVITLD